MGGDGKGMHGVANRVCGWEKREEIWHNPWRGIQKNFLGRMLLVWNCG